MRELVAAEINFDPIDEVTRDTCGFEFARLSRRWILVFCQIEGAMLWRQSIEAGGGTYRRTMIWTKPDGQPQLSGDRPGMGYESIVACHHVGRSSWNGGGRLGVFNFNKADPTVSTARGERNPHPTMKPLPLMLELIELFTDPGELIFDPFCGSGTTGVACLRLGRRFIGIEKKREWAELARERLRAEENNSTLQASRSGQTALFEDRSVA